MKGCTVCGNPTTNKCGKCGKAWYCSRDCQRQDWKNHKRNCNPFEIKESDGKGLGLFATCNLEVGDLIVREDPILYFDGANHSSHFRAVYEKLSKDDKIRIQALSGGEPDAQEWRKGFQIFVKNSIQVHYNGSAIALYETISRINHSCHPNAIWSFVIGQEKTKEVRAVKKIKKGEEIYACYFVGVGNSLTPCITKSSRRAKLLSSDAQFDCICSLCSSSDCEEEDLREKIKELDEIVVRCAPRGELKRAATAAFKKIELMKSCEGLNHDLPSAYMELYELLTAAKVNKIKINCRLIGLSANPEVYREKSLEVARPFKLDSFKEDYNIQVRKIAKKYGVQGNLWI